MNCCFEKLGALNQILYVKELRDELQNACNSKNSEASKLFFKNNLIFQIIMF